MVAPLQFRQHLPGFVGGREGVLAKTRELLAGEYKIAKAADASNIPIPKVREHVESIVNEAVCQLLQAPLSKLVEEHAAEVIAEYELLEGEEPQPPGSDKTWLEGLWTAQLASMTGEMLELLGREQLAKFVCSERTTADLVELMFEKLGDGAGARTKLGITDGDVDELIAIVRKKPEKAGFGIEEIAALVRQKLVAGGDYLELDEAVRHIFTATDSDIFDAAVAQLTTDSAIGQQIWAFISPRETDPIADDADADATMALAAQPEAAKSTEKSAEVAPPSAVIAMGKSPTVGQRRSPKENAKFESAVRQRAPRAEKGEPSPRSEAAKAIVATLCDATAATEVQVAEALGVSRAQMNNYRHGRAVLHPSVEQLGALERLLARYWNALSAVKTLYEQTFKAAA